MENKHPEDIWSPIHNNLYNLITIIYSFRKKEKKFKKKYFRYHFKNVIVTTKVIRRRYQRSIDSKDILRQSESEEVPNRQEVMGPISIQVSSAILQDQVTSFIINFTNLI